MSAEARKVMHSSKRMDWCTPEWFLDLVRQVGSIGYDPASSDGNPTGAQIYSTPIGTFYPGGIFEGRCGLTRGWSAAELLFCNPPYGRSLAMEWAPKMKAYEGEALYLVPNRPETTWHRSLYRWSQAHLAWSSAALGARINFVTPDGTTPRGGAAFPSSVFYSTGDVGVRTARARLRRFAEVFGSHGRLTVVS